MKTITVSIITYNQEDVIRRTLDSVLQQKEWGLYRVVISDDCSQDGTWDILEGYQAQHPELISIYRNEVNLGIYENIKRLDSYLPISDLYCDLAGDDEFCPNYFMSVQNLITSESINTDEAIGIYSDWARITPDGVRKVFKQDCVLSGNKLWSLKARGKIGGRSLIISQKVREGYEPILQGCGLNLTESHYDSQAPLNIKKAYYFPEVTTLYYAGIGVSSRLLLDKSDYLTTQCIEKWNYGLEHYVEDERDLFWGKYELLKAEYYLNPQWITIFRILNYYIKGQLPGCRDSISSSLRVFAGLIKFMFVS